VPTSCLSQSQGVPHYDKMQQKGCAPWCTLANEAETGQCSTSIQQNAGINGAITSIFNTLTHDEQQFHTHLVSDVPFIATASLTVHDPHSCADQLPIPAASCAADCYCCTHSNMRNIGLHMRCSSPVPVTTDMHRALCGTQYRQCCSSNHS
jgi:hypothetical protein